MTTNSKFNTAEVVRFARDTERRLEAEGIDPYVDGAMERAIAGRFPEMTRGLWLRVLDVWNAEVDAEHAEFLAEYERNKAARAMVEQIFAGLENVVKNFEEACRIKAQGEGPVAEAARQWLIAMNGVTARLGEAAHDAHPDFVRMPKGRWHYTGPGEMPSDDAVVEWFQINHPAQARAIEAEP
jgi:hypothetical protein